MKIKNSAYPVFIYLGLILCLFTSCSEESVNNSIADIEETIIPCNSIEIFENKSSNAVCFEIENNVRKVYTNNFPDHEYGPWRGPNTIEAQEFEYSMCLYPELTNTITEVKEDPNSQSCGGGVIFGVSNQGINYSPFARLYFEDDDGKENLDWHIEADFTLAMDVNGGHVNTVSRYHYHNIPHDYFINDLDIDGSAHSPLLGYAADGFPIYYKYGFAENSSSIVSYLSGYDLKSGSRPGDGESAPDGVYDGTYVEDYEYTSSDLDECGGRFGPTPEYPNGTYYYVLTDNWPYIPRCFKGKYIDNSFQISPGCDPSTAAEDCSSAEVVANADIFEALKGALNDSSYQRLQEMDFGSRNGLADVTVLKIYNSAGQLAYASDALFINDGFEKAGTYFVQLNFSNGQITKKVIL